MIALLAEGLTDTDIAMVLAVPVKAVVEQRRLQPPGPVVKPFSTRDDNIITEMRNKDRLWTQIGRRLNRSPEDVRARYEVILHRQLGTKPAQPKEIRCYGCRKKFISPDPKRQRGCPDCRSRQEGLTNDYTVQTPDSDPDAQPISEPTTDSVFYNFEPGDENITPYGLEIHDKGKGRLFR
jgi:Zn finger protein HypA/HybF involved in hydrogenase expression